MVVFLWLEIQSTIVGDGVIVFFCCNNMMLGVDVDVVCKVQVLVKGCSDAGGGGNQARVKYGHRPVPLRPP